MYVESRIDVYVIRLKYGENEQKILVIVELLILAKHETVLYYMPCVQSYEEVLSNLLDGLVSLSPLTSAIQEFASAAKEVEAEAQVK